MPRFCALPAKKTGYYLPKCRLSLEVFTGPVFGSFGGEIPKLNRARPISTVRSKIVQRRVYGVKKCMDEIAERGPCNAGPELTCHYLVFAIVPDRSSLSTRSLSHLILACAPVPFSQFRPLSLLSQVLSRSPLSARTWALGLRRESSDSCNLL
ncbi:hypothetical protein BDY21DRAFT_121788 [Lineolata rhizophorae]|uniref:Uncharacterized protein n=1 Tax=Lineolata rhizophorae TaxID=578093 RepID=A0A6A6NQM0_9PEZI|nr:hypothetical protein BDY21DRAFT_121788 [Lineolata rhizophorae]